MRSDVALQPSSKQDENQPELGRRGFLKWAAGGIGALALAPKLLDAAILNERYLFFYNPNTGETIRRVYWTPREGYIRESIGEISWALRDHHNDQVRQFDTTVFGSIIRLAVATGFGESHPCHQRLSLADHQQHPVRAQSGRGAQQLPHAGHGARSSGAGWPGLGSVSSGPFAGRGRRRLLSPLQLRAHRQRPGALLELM